MDSFSDVFERVKQLCRGEMSEVAYDLWIRELELTALDSSTACLQCTTQFKRDIVNEKYNALLTASFEEIMGFPVQVEITSREAAPAAPAAQENNRLDFQPEKEYSFETFVVGSGNSLAHAAAWAVANNPAKSYNPLFMYGGSGLGKTHLIYAICGKIRQNHPDYKLLYVKGEEFANELIWPSATAPPPSSRKNTARPTCWPWMIFSSSPARKAPRRNFSTPSIRCMNAASRSS